MPTCEICDKAFTAKRSSGKYCSPNCRSKAYYKRKVVQKNAEKSTYTFELLADIEKVGKLSKDAEGSLHRLFAIAGQAGTDLALAAIFDALGRAGYIYNEKLKIWQQLS